jgi:histone arginine demethylase JMJD6
MESYTDISEIERCSGLSEKQFYDKYVKKSIPVIVTDKAEWTSSEKFTIDYFKTHYNHLTRTVDEKTYTLSEIIDLCEASTPENKAPYPNIFDIDQDFPEFLDDITELFYGKSNRLQSRMLPNALSKRVSPRLLLFGGKGCSFPVLHFDYLGVHTQVTQVIGEKDFILYSPEQTPYFYPDKVRRNQSPINITNPDYDAYPLFKNAVAVKTTLKPGETIFIPSGWWHTTYIHDFNLTYTINQVNSFNWDIFMNESYLSAKKDRPVVARFMNVYKPIVGRIFNLKEWLFD